MFRDLGRKSRGREWGDDKGVESSGGEWCCSNKLDSSWWLFGEIPTRVAPAVAWGKTQPGVLEVPLSYCTFVLICAAIIQSKQRFWRQLTSLKHLQIYAVPSRPCRAGKSRSSLWDSGAAFAVFPKCLALQTEFLIIALVRQTPGCVFCPCCGWDCFITDI